MKTKPDQVHSWKKTTKKRVPPLNKVVVITWGNHYVLGCRVRHGWVTLPGNYPCPVPRGWCDINVCPFMTRSLL